MSAPPKVLELVELFRRNADAYHAPHYNEAMVRQEFINPLFKCLGWDMDNEQGYAEAYKVPRAALPGRGRSTIGLCAPQGVE